MLHRTVVLSRGANYWEVEVIAGVMAILSQSSPAMQCADLHTILYTAEQVYMQTESPIYSRY